jgi:tetratricopeptide (TPR) repeat protein
VVDLESRLAAAEAEKAKLANELAAAQAKGGAAVADSAADTVKPGSALYRELEKENATLKEKVAKLEVDRQAAVQELTATEAAAARSEELKQVVATAEMTQEKRKELIAALARRLLATEQELKQKDQELAALKGELDRREQRLQKVERLAVLLARTRKEVQGADEKERSDLHYNMAVVYAGKGQYEDAEREYLNALRTDPTDADAHFNLGILYEEIFKNKDKAAMHYRRFLKLRPDSPDAIQVREWLLHLETK